MSTISVLLAAFAAVGFEADGVPPCLVGLGGDPQVGLAGADGLDLLPEVVGQREDERLEAGVVQVGGPAPEVVDEQLADSLIADWVVADEFLDRPLSPCQRGPHRQGRARREHAHGVQHVPGGAAGEAVGPGLAHVRHGRLDAAGLVRVVQQRAGGDVRERDALNGQQAAQLVGRVAPRPPRRAERAGVLDELVQQRIVLGLDEELRVPLEALSRRARLDGRIARRQNSERRPGETDAPVVRREPRELAVTSPSPSGLASHRCCQVPPGKPSRYSKTSRTAWAR